MSNNIGYGFIPNLQIPFNLNPANSTGVDVIVSANRPKQDNTLLYMGIAALLIIVAVTSKK